ncbi:Hexapeptide repeat of succinyl-transferase [Sphingopyxis terrae subsp. ummariensis]|uniref:Hexapeptide repeat of succinyl-transferase n=2 Tax=Sphingopyxis terrae TaxID=33052 RepID=A0A1Y6FVL0_9SPHN|nr:Hexapeptide repeat of succinyl-transferase [Sphingopyxis terrae subsp. ummariensis]
MATPQMTRKITSIVNRLVDIAVFRLRGGVALARRKGVTVGDNCRIYIRDFGSEPFLITIGNNVTITAGVFILTHDGSTALVTNSNGSRYQRYGPVKIGNNVFIGVNSVVLPNVTIGSNVVIGAGSIVTRDVPDNIVVAGNPARPHGDFDDFSANIRHTQVNDDEISDISDYRQRVERSIAIANERRK